jgi:hypothetical protein
MKNRSRSNNKNNGKIDETSLNNKTNNIIDDKINNTTDNITDIKTDNITNKYGGLKNKRVKDKKNKSTKNKEFIDDEQQFKEVNGDKIHTFIHKPIIIGNKALEIYGFPVKQQEYIDCVIHQDDYEILKKKDKMYKFKYIKNSSYHNLTNGLIDEERKINFITNIYIYNYDILAVEALEKDPFDISCLDYILLIKILKSMDPKLKQYKEKHLDDIAQVTKILYTFC